MDQTSFKSIYFYGGNGDGTLEPYAKMKMEKWLAAQNPSAGAESHYTVKFFFLKSPADEQVSWVGCEIRVTIGAKSYESRVLGEDPYQSISRGIEKLKLVHGNPSGAAVKNQPVQAV